MSGKVWAVDQNIIKKDEHKLSEVWGQGSVHGLLESTRSPSEAKSHYTEFELTKVSLEGHFEFFTQLHADLMKPHTQIQTCEPGSTSSSMMGTRNLPLTVIAFG